MKKRHINTTLTITALALATFLILTALPQAGTAAPTVASLSTNPKRINESAEAHSFIRSPFVDSTPGATTRISAAPRLERQPLESLTALNSTEAAERGAPSAAPMMQAADPENVEFVGHIGGRTGALAVQGNYAYINEGRSLTILDVTIPASPTVVGKTTFLSSSIINIAVAGEYAYVTVRYGGGEGSLRVVDISDPANPAEVGACDMIEYGCNIAVAGEYAYVTGHGDGEGSLRVVDVSDPTNPTEVGFYDTPHLAIGVAIAGNYAYVGGGRSGLRVIDISDPTDPIEVGAYDTPGHANGVSVAGDYVYVSDGGHGLRVIDISDATNPTEVGSYNVPQSCGDVAVVGNYAYATNSKHPDNSDCGLWVVDVSTPSDPRGVGSYNTPGNAGGVVVAGSHAYVTDGEAGLQVVDISDPANPTGIGSYDTPSKAENVAVVGNYAYVADSAEKGLHVVDVSDPANPLEIGFCGTPDGAFGVAVDGIYAYVAGGTAGLRVVDVSDPAIPTETGFYDTPGIACEVAVAGDYVYVADRDAGLRVVDVSDPTNPTEVGFSDVPDDAAGVSVVGDHAYVADFDEGNSGLWVVDISTPLDPITVGFCNTAGRAVDVTVAGNYAYVAGNKAGLRVVDIFDPTNPTEVGSYDRRYVRDVAVVGNYAYIANYGDGLRVVDVSTPSNPTEVGSYDTIYAALGIAVVGGYTYVADGSGGLVILRFTGGEPAKPPVVLVHGWQGIGIPGIDGNDCTDTPTRVYPGTNRFFGNSPQWLYDLGYTEIYEVNLTTGPGYTPLFEENAECLSRQLKWVTDRHGKAILIAHSMGGLVSRAYMENENLYRDDVVRLITLGSPHAGINWGFLVKILLGLKAPEAVAAYCLIDPGTCQLSTEQVLVFDLKHNSRASGVSYDFIGSRKTPFPLGWFLSLTDGPNDGIVGLASATGKTYWTDLKVVDGKFVSRYQTDETHSGYFGDDPGQTRSCLQYLLGENGTGGSCVQATAMMVQAQAPAIAYSLDVRGHITSSQTITHTLQVDADGASLFYLSWMTGTLGITLTNPVGTVIDPVYAAAHTDVVTYTTSPGSDMTPPFAAYAFTTTVPGLYTATITADDVGITGTDYLLFAAMETTRTLTVALDSGRYQIGDTAVLTATLEGAGDGITGATVQATFSRSDAITDTLTLTDQGDGTYRGTYAIPNAPGYLHLRVTAEGSDAGTQFNRQVDRLLTVASQAVQLTETYADRADDADGNGRYETLTVDVEVLAAGAGDFTFSADLVNGGDQFVAHVITQTALITGTQSVPLSFDGDLIHEGGSDGPFGVTNLLISDLQNAGIPSVMADDVWTTAAYDHTQFGRITGDLDGNCVVNIVDIMLVASRWNTSIGDIRYDATYDQDGDGNIDIADIMLVAVHWGESCE